MRLLLLTSGEPSRRAGGVQQRRDSTPYPRILERRAPVGQGAKGVKALSPGCSPLRFSGAAHARPAMAGYRQSPASPTSPLAPASNAKTNDNFRTRK